MADSSEWAMDTFSETKEKDPLRLLDLENDTQMLLSKFPGARTEKERATNNFNSMVFGDAKPIGDHLVEGAGRVLPTLTLGLADLGIRGVWKGINKLFNKPITRRQFKNHVKDQLKDLEKIYGKTLIGDLNDKYFKDVKEPLKDALDYASKKVGNDVFEKDLELDALGELGEVYEHISSYLPRRIKSGGLTSEEKYLKYLQERDTLVKTSKMKPEELDKIAKAALDEESAREAIKINNLGDTLESDMAKNPDKYINFKGDEASLFELRKYLANSRRPQFFNEGTERFYKPLTDEELKRLRKEKWRPVLRDAKIGLIASGAEGIADVAEENLRNFLKIQNEPVFKNFTFDKEPDTSFPKTLLHSLADMVGVDWRNPNRFNASDIQDFLEEAQKKGLLSNDNWKNWTARQQVEKVDEIAHSPYARQFIKYLEEK